MGQGRLLHPRFSFPSLGVLRDARVRNDTPERRQILFAFCSGHSHTRCVILPEGRLAPAGRGSRPERGHRDGVSEAKDPRLAAEYMDEHGVQLNRYPLRTGRYGALRGERQVR